MNFIGNITIGQFIPKPSFLHKTDPRAKIIFTLFFIIAIFLSTNFYQYAFLSFFIFFLIFLSKISPLYYLRGVKSLWILIVLTALFQIFSGSGKVLVGLGPLKITDLAISNTIFIVLRLVLIIIAASLLTLTTSPIQIADGLEGLMVFFKLPREWSHDFSMMMSIAFRFIPVLSMEADHIIRAQLSRGARFDRGGLIQRAKGMVPLIVPLFVGSMKMADDLAIAMEARCYRGFIGRTKFREMKFRFSDYLIILSGIFLIFLIFVVRM
ncbi:energy-coupling factor transporter transmembrane component T family protein [Athalassotoga sp.]|uniref:energy-coupling factor transporter transmembrane component T family protein n=1 Tax=Athalassotoga sp. TaxID=2022597 RepID=UPI003D06BDC2